MRKGISDTPGEFASEFWPPKIGTSEFQSEVGEVFGEIGGELPAKFGGRLSSFFCWGKSSEVFSTKTLPQISPSNFTARFWVVAGPTKISKESRVAKQGGFHSRCNHARMSLRASLSLYVSRPLGNSANTLGGCANKQDA